MTLQIQFSFKRTSEHHGSLIAHGTIKTTQCRSQLEAVRPIGLRQSSKTRRLNGVKCAFSVVRRQVPGDESLRVPNPLMNLDGSFKTLAFLLRSYRKLESSMGQNRQMGKRGWTHTSLVNYWLREHFTFGSITVAQSLTVDPSFSLLLTLIS